MKRLFLLLLAAALLAALALGASATVPFVADHAQLLEESEQLELEEQAARMTREYKTDIVILTVDSLGGKTPGEYADDYYDTHGYGDDGILLLLSMEERDWYVSTTGSARQKLRDRDIDRCMEDCLPYISDGDYYRGFSLWLSGLPGYLSREPEQPGVNWWISLGVGLGIAGIALLAMWRSMNTRRRQSSAAAYISDGSFRLKGQMDLFLYSTVSKTPKPKSNSPSGGGRSHGGGGGKF